MVWAVWKWGDFKNWKSYQSNMLFFSIGNLLYKYFTANYFLWRINADFSSSYVMTDMIYTFVVFPATALLFQSRFPDNHIFRYYLKWIIVYILVEVLFIQTGRIQYQYGWSIYWSGLFNIIMFPMLRIHHTRPLLAYILSIPIIVFLIMYFDVPVNVPVEKR